LFHTEIPEKLEFEYVHEDSLFSQNIFSNVNSNSIEKFAISIEETKNQATYIGKLYEAENNNFWLLLIAIGIGLMIVSIIIYYKFFKDKTSNQNVLFSSYFSERTTKLCSFSCIKY
jgi:hypothetical protein